MPDAYRILSSPVRVSGPLHLHHLSALVSGDALVRRARAQGRPVDWSVASLAGDLAGQAAVERELAREGHDRSSLGRDAFVERVRTAESENRARAQADLARLGVEADLDAGAIDSPAAARAARTAFVRLFEAGLLVREERVVDICTRCETVVEPADADSVELPVEVLHVRLSTPDGSGSVDLDVVAGELLPGAVAVVVPEDHPLVGQKVVVPVAGIEVPVVGEPGRVDGGAVVPGHDTASLELSRRLGMTPTVVLDRDGVVQVEGPLQGLTRFAARAAVAELLAAEGVVVGSREDLEPAGRCRRCGTILVPRLGRHWFLPMAELEVAAADVVRQGVIEFAPPAAREVLLSRAGQGGDWCLSHQVWAGEPVPASRCLDCGQTSVAVEPSDTCTRCMGTLEPVEDVLDARFLAGVWPLAAAGWPDDEGGPAELAPSTVLLVDPPGVVRWALLMAALGLRLAGAVPFCQVAVQEAATTEDDLDPTLPVDLESLLEEVDRRVLRAALVGGGLDVEAARSLVEGIDQPAEGEADIDALAAAYDAAFAAGTPAAAVAALAAAVETGVRAGAADRVRALAAPILGD